jgi:HAD superfamily hydrolase (TIGR01549 family)
MEEEPLPLLARARYPYLLEFLSATRSRGLRLAALSDYDPDRKLRALGVSAFFDLVASAADPEIQAFKPDPRGLLVVLRRLGVPAHRALYVGDRIAVDARAAQRAGIPCAIIGRSAAAGGAGFLQIRDYRQLCAITARH